MSVVVDAIQVLGFLALIAMALLFWWGSKWFVSHKDIKGFRDGIAKEIDAVASQRAEDLAESRAAHKALREEIHTTLGRMEIEAGRRHDGMTRQMEEVARELHKALERSEKATDVSYEARNQANTAALEITHLSERLRDALAPLKKLSEIPERVARMDERLQMLTADKVKRESDRKHSPGGGS